MSTERNRDDYTDARRRRSRFDREPSPKRSRRDAKPDAERARNVPRANSAERGENHGRQLQNSSPHEVTLISVSKADGSTLNKDSYEKTQKISDDTKVPSNPTEVPRSRSYFQHDERGVASHGSRSSNLRGTTGNFFCSVLFHEEQGWQKKSRDRGSERAVNQEFQQEEARPKKEDGNDRKVWGHDGFFEIEANPPPPAPTNRKRPAFREHKISSDNVKNDRNGKNEDLKLRTEVNQVSNVGRRGERAGHRERYPDRFKKSSPRGGARPYRRDERQSGAYGSRDRYGGGNGRESNSGLQQPFHSYGGRVEKWKHDLYDEANKSPPLKNEEDRLARIEALLSS